MTAGGTLTAEGEFGSCKGILSGVSRRTVRRQFCAAARVRVEERRASRPEQWFARQVVVQLPARCFVRSGVSRFGRTLRRGGRRLPRMNALDQACRHLADLCVVARPRKARSGKKHNNGETHGNFLSVACGLGSKLKRGPEWPLFDVGEAGAYGRCDGLETSRGFAS